MDKLVQYYICKNSDLVHKEIILNLELKESIVDAELVKIE